MVEVLPKINSAHGSDTRNIINRAIELLNRLGVDVQTLVAEGQLTPAQYAELVSVVNENISKGEVSVHDINKNLGKFDQTFMTDEFINQFVENTQPVNALTAPHSQTTIKLADKAISPSKTNFMNISTNLIDESKALLGKTISNTTGEPIDSTGGNSASDWIEVTPNTEFIGYRVNKNAFYTQDRQFISITQGDGLFTTPSDCYWVRVAAPTNYIGLSAQLNKGNVLLPFESHYEHLKLKHLQDESVDLEKLTLLSKTNRPILSGNEIDFSFSDNMIKVSGVRVVYGNENILIGQTLDISDIPSTAAVQWLLFYDKDTDSLQTRNALSLVSNRMSANSIPIAIFRRNDKSVWGLNDYKIDGVSIFNHNLIKSRENNEIITDTFVLDTDINKLFDKNTTYPNMEETSANAKSADIYQMYDELLDEYPNYISKELLGHESSPDALPIYKYEFKPVRPDGGQNLRMPKHILLTGTHPERSAVWTLYNVMENICKNWMEDELLEALRFNFHFIVVPIVSPWAYDQRSRTNFNGVDMNRNYKSGWVQGTFGTPTYGGTAPLSEKEAQYIDKIMTDNLDALSVVDFHSFQGTVDSYDFLWFPTGNVQSSSICTAHLQRMDRKWKKDYPSFMNQSYDTFIGYVSGSAGGTTSRQANAYGFKGALTCEMCDIVRADPTGTRFDSNVMNMGYESFVNFLLMLSKELLKKL